MDKHLASAGDIRRQDNEAIARVAAHQEDQARQNNAAERRQVFINISWAADRSPPIHKARQTRLCRENWLVNEIRMPVRRHSASDEAEEVMLFLSSKRSLHTAMSNPLHGISSLCDRDEKPKELD